MNSIFLLIPLLIFGVGIAYAEPLEDIQTSVLDYENNYATVQLTWNPDDTISNYEIGCVSCIPNFSESTTNSEIILQNITSLENGLALLYIIAYGDNDEIITAKQVTLELR
jgi:hypothetical protein